MKVLKILSGLKNSLFFWLLLLSMGFSFLCFSDINYELKSAIKNCVYSLLPSLFPTLLFSSLISSVGCPAVISRIIHPVMNFLFGIPGNCFTTILVSLLCGYNIAGRCSLQMFEKGEIDIGTAKRVAMFFVAPGVSFSVFYTGVSMLGNVKTGIFLLLSSMAASCFCAFIYNTFHRNNAENNTSNNNDLFADIIIKSVNDTSVAIINIFSWILLFTVIVTIVKTVFNNTFIADFIVLFGEITNSITFCIKSNSLFLTEFCLSVGGIGIILQQLPGLRKLGVDIKEYVFITILRSVIATLIFRFFSVTLHLVDSIIPAFNRIEMLSSSFTGSSALLLLAVVFICAVNDIKQEVIAKL